MKPSQLVALALGVALGAVAACFTAPPLTGPYRCSLDGGCPDSRLSCVGGVCCTYSGEPACPGSNGDAGPCGSPCSVPGLLGVCAGGVVDCDGGANWCVPTGSASPEVCNGLDDDCNGAADEQPGCGGPSSFLAPDAGAPRDGGFTTGAQRSLYYWSLPPFCLKDYSGNVPERFDGTRWTAPVSTGSGTAVTHIAWVEAADGGSWDLRKSGLKLVLSFTGQLFQANATTAFPTAQPQILLCGGGAMRRLDPGIQQLMLSGNPPTQAFTLAIQPTLTGDDAIYKIGAGSNPSFDLSRVERIEVAISTQPNGSTNAGWDVWFSRFDLVPP